MPSAPAATISPSGAIATVLSGVGSVTIVRRAAGQRPDAQRRVVAGGDDRLAVGREGDAVDVILMALEHARLAAGERPQPRGVIPRRRRERRAVRRNRERHHRRLVAFKHGVGLRLAGRQIAMRVSSPLGGGAAVGQQRHRVHRAVVEAQHLGGGVLLQRPADGGRVEAAGQRRLAVGRDRERPHRPAMAAQLRMRRDGGSRQARAATTNNANANHRSRL